MSFISTEYNEFYNIGSQLRLCHVVIYSSLITSMNWHFYSIVYQPFIFYPPELFVYVQGAIWFVFLNCSLSICIKVIDPVNYKAEIMSLTVLE